MENDDLTSVLDQLYQEYPTIAPYNFAARWGQPQTDFRQLEFFQPDEPSNPFPGRPTIEVYNRGLKGNELKTAIFGDALHYLPTVDPTFAYLRNSFAGTRTNEQRMIDMRAYNRSVNQHGELNTMRGYLRGTKMNWTP